MTLKTNRALIFDVDGVMLDWHGGFRNWMGGQGFEDALPDETHYDLTKHFPKFNQEGIVEQINKFNRDEQYAHLPHVPGVTAGLHDLWHSHAAHLRFVVVSATGRHIKTIYHRTYSLMDFPPFDECYFLDVADKKGGTFALFDTGSIVFEDNVKHAEEAVRRGHHVVLVDRPYNSDLEGEHIHRIFHWKEALPIVNQLLD